MKNLKKLLALVLALMMVMSMMVTASAATFPDDADIDHKEAVDVMAAAGILVGDNKGYFNPDKNLERSSAAKLIAYLMLGENIAYIEKTATPFVDVPATHWASGFIAYVAEVGIVVGNGAGNFYPDPNAAKYPDATKDPGLVNAASFAKMVMLALCDGDVNMIKSLDSSAKYNDAAGEWTTAPFTGSSYVMKINMGMSKLKSDYGIDLKAGLSDLEMTAPLTREHAAQMVFNALHDSGKLQSVYGLTKDDNYSENGLDGYVWYYTAPNGSSLQITEPVITDVYVDSFSSGTTYADVMKALGVTEKSTLKGINYMNSIKGAEVVPAEWVDSEATISLATNLDVYKTADGKTLKFMYTEETLVVPTVAANPVGSGVNKGLYKWDFGGAPTYAAKDAYDTQGAYLVVIANDNGTKSLVGKPKLAETETGVVVGKGADYVTIKGVKYFFKNTKLLNSIKLGDERVLYLATDGTVLDCTTVTSGGPTIKPAETVIYVLGFYSVKVEAVPGSPAQYNEYGEKIKDAVPGVPEHYDRYVQYVTLSGEVETALYDDATTEREWAAVNKMKAITFDNDGIAILTDPTEGVISAAGITSNAAKFTVGGVNYYYTNADVVQITDSLSKATVSAGTLKGAVAASATAWAVYTGEGTNKTITTIFYWVKSDSADIPTVDPDVYTDMLLLKDSTSSDTGLITTKDKNGNDQYTPVHYHQVYLAGVPMTIKTYGNKITAGAKSYQVDEYGVFVEINDLSNTVTGEITNVYGALISVDGGVEDYNITNVPVKDLSANGNKVLDLGDTVLYIYTPDKASTPDVNEFAITMIYIITSVSK